jgi:hypothetical protein
MKILFTRTAQIMTICACTLLVSACSNNNDDLYRFIKTTKAMHVGSVKPIPQFEPYKNFTYSAGKLRDPFEPSADLQPTLYDQTEIVLASHLKHFHWTRYPWLALWSRKRIYGD